MSSRIVTLLRRAQSLLDSLGWAGPLLVRVSLASVFVVTGWGKLHDLAKVTGYFTELGIPFPGLNAVLVATTELVGGSLVLVGLFTRLAAIPLALSMLVAIFTGKRADIDGIVSVFAFTEFTYLACFVWLAVAGAGAISLDRMLFGRRPAPLPRPLLRPEAPDSGEAT